VTPIRDVGVDDEDTFADADEVEDEDEDASTWWPTAAAIAATTASTPATRSQRTRIRRGAARVRPL
jgi:hypothetical protein